MKIDDTETGRDVDCKEVDAQTQIGRKQRCEKNKRKKLAVNNIQQAIEKNTNKFKR